MTTLADMPFHTLRAGMKFRHPSHGEQVILDLGQGLMGPAIWFHDCTMYSGRMPEMSSEEEGDIFDTMARNIFPHGAEEWEFLGLLLPDEIADHGWHMYEVSCPHCAAPHRFLAPSLPTGQRTCLACGMIGYRPPREVDG